LSVVVVGRLRPVVMDIIIVVATFSLACHDHGLNLTSGRNTRISTHGFLVSACLYVVMGSRYPPGRGPLERKDIVGTGIRRGLLRYRQLVQHLIPSHLAGLARTRRKMPSCGRTTTTTTRCENHTAPRNMSSRQPTKPASYQLTVIG
jgi:hypothetical protein